MECIDVTGQSECCNVGLKSIDDGSGLFAGPSMRLLDGYLLAALRLPVLGESCVELVVKFAGGIIRNVQELLSC